MAYPYIGEIQLFAIDFAPKGWLPCDGRILQIHDNAALYSLLGTSFGGNGTTTFALPDLRGRAVAGEGMPARPGQSTYVVGSHAGQETVQIPLPTHTHELAADNANAAAPVPGDNYLAAVITSAGASLPLYSNSAPSVAINSATVSPAGGTDGHDNMQPSLVLNYCIATIGDYPPQP